MSLSYDRPLVRMSTADQNRALHEIAVEVASYVTAEPVERRDIAHVTAELAHKYGLSRKEVLYGIHYGLSHEILQSQSSLGPLSSVSD